jgi:hypothetical protein
MITTTSKMIVYHDRDNMLRIRTERGFDDDYEPKRILDVNEKVILEAESIDECFEIAAALNQNPVEMFNQTARLLQIRNQRRDMSDKYYGMNIK